jgi:hypothetical protein
MCQTSGWKRVNIIVLIVIIMYLRSRNVVPGVAAANQAGEGSKRWSVCKNVLARKSVVL